MKTKIFLVLAQLQLSNDGGHTTTQIKEYWVKAPGKQAAARLASLYLRNRMGSRLISDSIYRVIAKDDWGDKYFPRISQEMLDS